VANIFSTVRDGSRLQLILYKITPHQHGVIEGIHPEWQDHPDGGYRPLDLTHRGEGEAVCNQENCGKPLVREVSEDFFRSHPWLFRCRHCDTSWTSQCPHAALPRGQ
jgi:hypothetical protein